HTSPEAGGAGWNQFVDRIQHLVLPTFTLALMGIAGYSRYQRNAMLDVLGQDFIRTADAASRKLLVRILTKAGYSCSQVSDVIEALASLRADPPSLLLL